MSNIKASELICMLGIYVASFPFVFISIIIIIIIIIICTLGSKDPEG